jgi:hypothetical protein
MSRTGPHLSYPEQGQHRWSQSSSPATIAELTRHPIGDPAIGGQRDGVPITGGQHNALDVGGQRHPGWVSCRLRSRDRHALDQISNERRDSAQHDGEWWCPLGAPRSAGVRPLRAPGRPGMADRKTDNGTFTCHITNANSANTEPAEVMTELHCGPP